MDLEWLRNEIIGSYTLFNSPYGKRLITYADYTASGKTLIFIEKYLMKLQEVYANTHTVDSFTGKTMTTILHESFTKIKKFLGANENNYIIPVATGATGAIAKLSEILGLYLTPGLKMKIDQFLYDLKKENRYHQEIIKELFKNMNETKPVIFVSPYEHHSNYLIWKESFAEVIEINLTPSGEFDYDDLEEKIKIYENRIKIGSFSAASNITGIKSDVYHLAKIMHEHHGLVFFDFAASGPYVEINMNRDDESYFDALFLSPHKFIGGPGSSGILVINKHLYNTIYSPTVAGGGTVDFVSPYCYQFSEDVEVRENAGTPGILQIIKASLVLELKDAIGTKRIEKIENHYNEYVFEKLKNESNLIILGPNDPDKRISIFSFNIKHENKLLHYKFVAKLLNDLFGIQSRAGCACAGPYAHHLLNINKKDSTLLEEMVELGFHSIKPGFIRVNFHYLMTKEEVDFIVNAIQFIAQNGYLFLSQYKFNKKLGTWEHRYQNDYNPISDSFCLEDSLNEKLFSPKIDKRIEYNKYLQNAKEIAALLLEDDNPIYQRFYNLKLEYLRWFNFIYCD